MRSRKNVIVENFNQKLCAFAPRRYFFIKRRGAKAQSKFPFPLAQKNLCLLCENLFYLCLKNLRLIRVSS